MSSAGAASPARRRSSRGGRGSRPSRTLRAPRSCGRTWPCRAGSSCTRRPTAPLAGRSLPAAGEVVLVVGSRGRDQRRANSTSFAAAGACRRAARAGGAAHVHRRPGRPGRAVRAPGPLVLTSQTSAGRSSAPRRSRMSMRRPIMNRGARMPSAVRSNDVVAVTRVAVADHVQGHLDLPTVGGEDAGQRPSRRRRRCRDRRGRSASGTARCRAAVAWPGRGHGGRCRCRWRRGRGSASTRTGRSAASTSTHA